MAPARRATANVEAPVWKSYLAVRVDQAQVAPKALAAPTALMRTRKRAKPSSVDVTSHGLGGVASKQQLATRASVRAYWGALNVQERLQILMVDDPDIVKQLYKLNLSLLCVGLMQRHLKAGTARAAAAVTSADTDKSAANGTATDVRPATTATNTSSDTQTTEAASETVTASDSERTYDLLEAMEFMDIGTGILTVKTELVEEVERMFALVTAVLHGFLASIHVLSETQFRDLFVTESEVINTWEDYEKLIAMLVEQLMLRSYVAHLEKQATQQMEALLLEASLEEKGETTAVSHVNAQKKKKKKKKKGKSAKTAEVGRPNETAGEDDSTEDLHSDCECELEQEEAVEKAVEALTCNSECSTEDADLSGPSSPVKSMGKSLYSLNPHAQVFQPSFFASLPIEEAKSPVSGKRKLDEFIIHIPWQDLVDDVDGDDLEMLNTREPLDAEAGELGCRRPREKYRRRDEDAELEWHLQHMYASTSSLLGWDFNEQREIAAMQADPWVDAALWRTDPRDVVRYYFPPSDPPRAFASAAFPPTAIPHAAAATPPSRYYFTPAGHPPHVAPHAAPPTSSASMFPPFMPPPSAPVSLWDENASHPSSSPSAAVSAASSTSFAEPLEPPAYPKFRPVKSTLPRVRSAASPRGAAHRR